ncbi:CcdB family protein [Halomonas rhizosphaerae]|uniref:Toxin CcdB n=1 Tax=Halomonas rhizosphaerae TaxID=3043296 RepID=A0ABT6V279_9GAMM|nr:CcdB family protein [Halomonas rhizosphaerae]MDI5892328.1 CcdB family protein [Halomonas rhizosphaerae]MDI5920039.1 CcdB family protein [Halomonas rhizosphaerae]
MAQFNAYENRNPASRERYPYLLDIQSDLLEELCTTVVVPLCPATQAESVRMTYLNPIIEIDGERYIALTQELAGIERKRLGRAVHDLGMNRDRIMAAIDFLMTGI